MSCSTWICIVVLLAASFIVSRGTKCSYRCRQSYSVKCQFWKWQRCRKNRDVTCYRCCDGWTGSTSAGCPTPICFGSTYCPNGGSCQRPDYCRNCNRGYYSPRCAKCSSIANCLEVYCSTSSDQRCDRCSGDYGTAQGRAYRKSSDQRRCIKQCSWRSNSNACYPGSCTDGSCSCTSGFYGTDCRTLSSSQSPTISEHRATLIRGTTTLESPKVQGSTATVYTNVRDFISIRINWKSSYQPTGLPNPSSGGHPYIQSRSLGIIDASVTAVVNRGSSTVNLIGTEQCTRSTTGTNFNQANPATSLVNCERTFTLSYNSWNPATGDVLRYDVQASNGGYLKLYNRDSSSSIITRYYSGRVSSRYATFTFDFVPPAHCLGAGGGCQTSMLNVGNDVTSQARITVSWQSWTDNLAGIKEYDLSVRQLSGSHGSEMSEDYSNSPLYSGVTNSGRIVTLPHIGVYSFVLTVVDNADNIRLCRRFVFFDDDTNDVTIQSGSPLRVQSATSATDYTWLTDLSPPGQTTPVNIVWTNHFTNRLHLNQGLLKPIGTYASSIDSGYDQNFGQRGRAAIPNVLGVTQFRVIADIDHQGGSSIVNPSLGNADAWRNEGINTQVTLDLNIMDGDSVRLWVEARDIAGHSERGDVLVHVDSSPPVIEDFWLVRDGEVNLAVHNSLDLHDMSVEFRAYDVHSGLRTIEWYLFDNHTGVDLEHGRSTIPARQITNSGDCVPSSCMCVPLGACFAVDYGFHPTFHIGVHDYDYFITLTVTNEARLVTTQTIQITVDVSPPQTGVVHDGIRGSNEVDFQDSPNLSAFWEGFFDKESGVKFYEYLFDESCRTAQDIDSVREKLVRTTSTHASWTAPSSSQYYVTVIAYNRALEPSVPVCSDGVTIDTSSPELSEIAVSELRMWPGLAKDSGGRVWFIDEHRRKVELVGVTSSCRSKATLVVDVSIYPDLKGASNDSFTVLDGDETCVWISGIEEKFFLPTHKYVTISWEGDDVESSIFDYEVGLSPGPDLVSFTSTSAHRRFVLYHPHISQGSVFDLFVRAINKAQLATSKAIGPIIVDTTPPMFGGHVSVRVQDEYLIAEWVGFTDDEDTGLVYQVAVGSTPGGTETVPYLSEKYYRDGPCRSQTSCAAFELNRLGWHLHGDHEYYVSVRAKNGAGLATVGTSSVYRHIVQLPSLGVVLDVAPPGEKDTVDIGLAKDIDVQMDTSSISARWFGFEHPHLDITYDIAVGHSGEGLSDVSGGFIDVGNATYYRLEGLTLSPLTTYFVTVRASSDAGSINVTSDGIQILQEGQILNGATIRDGLGCDQDDSSAPDLSHHSSTPHRPCEDDITYQSSTSDVSARWSIPEALQPFVTNVFWALEKEIEIYQDDENTTIQWITELDYQDLGMAFQHVGSNVGLMKGAHYRSKVKFCHVGVCFQPIISDGFWVLSQPPEVGKVTVTNIDTEEDKTDIRVMLQPFEHDYVRHDDPRELMAFYEWSIAEDGIDGALLSQWTRIDNLLFTGEVARFTALYSGKLDHDVCLRLSVRGYNKAGLSSIASTEMVDCDDVTLVVPHVVIDADHAVNLEQNAEWPGPDKNYISSKTILSAVWPTLRHRQYVWAAIEDTGSNTFGNLDNGLQYPCDHPMVKACGNTEKEYVNVAKLSLQHGKRYRICIHADEKTVIHEVWTETLPSVSSCSDGVVVDTTPPTPGSLWIGWDKHQTYQSSVSELVLHWESFDVEEHKLARHHSGIKYYEYAIGSMRGGRDIKDFTRVGIANNVIVHDLRLQNGHIYFATVRAIDFVGLTSQAMSESVTVDTTPPVVNTKWTLDVGGSFLHSTESVSAGWQNVFSDKESGIAYYEWAVGSNAGHADIMPFTRENSELGVTDPSRPLTLQEGHSYFVSVKAINTVDLITLRSFGAYTVDTSAPLAGHVFDGNPALAPANHRDQDFQEERSALGAFWEGFHDPHSAIVGYSWKAGKCSGCSDTVPEQHVGLDTSVSAEYLNLVPGLKYYVTVTACNAADLCTSVTSDGVLIDDSPPVPGHVYDGSPGNGDINFQFSRFRLSAHWWGFHDPHSSLSHYEWRTGTTPGSDDILPSTCIELSENTLTFLSNEMPIGSTIYTTVRAYNRLGMWSEATSNGFHVDTSAPEIVNEPAVDETLGVAVVDTQVLRDLIRFSWIFDDPESGIKDQYVSVSTHHNGDINIPPTKIAGSETDYTFTDLTLHEGSTYVVTVVACNHAGLCTEAKPLSMFFDGSPPSVGTFAIGTESAANLERHHIVWISPTEPAETTSATSVPQDTPSAPQHTSWMTWLEDPGTSTGSLALAWLGFADVHSGIDYYLITVGRTYGGSELTPDGPVRVDYNRAGMPLDEGVAQTAIIPLEGSITSPALVYLYVSLWAVNGVGLASTRHHSTFEISHTSPSEGALVLLRRCSSATCEGHCACAPLDRLCPTMAGGCNDVTIGNLNTEIEVLDVLDVKFGDINSLIDIDHTATLHMMAGVWRITQHKGMDIIWYEWSVGDDSSSDVVPVGVFDSAVERVWFDVGQDSHVIITLDEDHKLLKGVKYHIFVRAWYDANTYAVFRSDGITPDVTPPIISTIRGTKIKDLWRADASRDTDYLTDPSAVYISWNNVFFDDAISHYQVSLSTYPGGEDIRQFADHTFLASASSTHFAGLDLQSGQRYYINVRAFNKAGLHSLKSSDGFVVDTRRPDSGLVFDGIVLHDVEYQNSSSLISASWHGFVDLESYIDHYEWCVGQTPSPDDNAILPCADVGIHISSSKTLSLPLVEGIRYYSRITAVDAAGLRSETISSDGFVVDNSPPQPLQQETFGENLLKNPSFEDVDGLGSSDVGTSTPASTPENVANTDDTTAFGMFETASRQVVSTTSPVELLMTESSDLNISSDDPVASTTATMNKLSTTEGTREAPGWTRAQWDIGSGSQFRVIPAGKKIAQDGRSFLSLYGSISQTFSTTSGSHYQVSFVASHTVPSHDPLLNQEGRIEAPGLNRIFRLYDRLPHGHSDQDLQSIQWHQHRFYFTASEDVSMLKISSVGRSNGILLDNIQVRQITVGPSSGLGSVEVKTQFIHSWSSIQAKWHFTDPESPIVDYSWAIGTTKGGTQLQSFVLVGTQTDAINSDLNMQHGSYVYVTVTARNAADLIAIATSQAMLIDLTPPRIDYVTDGENAQDIDFSANDHSLTFSWSASDSESGIEHCEWAVGSEPGFDDILPSTSTSSATSTVTASISSAMVEGQLLFATVRCYNHAERSSWKSSDGVTIVTEPPRASAAVVNIKALSETQYITRDRYQSQRSSFRGSWVGFTDPFGIQQYECHLCGPSVTQAWTPCGDTSENHVDWSGLSLIEDATYSLSVRAINHAGLVSTAISQNFTVESTRPVGRATGLITSSWLGGGAVDLKWDGLFTSSSSLVYEVSVGTMPGASDIIQWVETMETGIRVSPLAPNTDYYLTLTAINKAGLAHTVTKIVNDA